MTQPELTASNLRRSLPFFSYSSPAALTGLTGLFAPLPLVTAPRRQRSRGERSCLDAHQSYQSESGLATTIFMSRIELPTIPHSGNSSVLKFLSTCQESSSPAANIWDRLPCPSSARIPKNTGRSQRKSSLTPCLSVLYTHTVPFFLSTCKGFFNLF